jgi:6-phosphogluconolactonase
MSGRKNASHSQLIISPDLPGLARSAAQEIVTCIRQALESQPSFSLVLSGGSTPKNVYSLLADGEHASQVDWERLLVFFGDERCVPPQHRESNYRMVRETLLDKVPLPAEKIHRIRGEDLPAKAAAIYQAELEGIFPGRNLPHFDLVLLGMGEDGHVASLFPGSQALEEKVSWVVSVEHHQPPLPLVDRVTMTLPVINAARRVMLIVSGGGKAGMVARAFEYSSSDKLLPVQKVGPVNGELVWLLDEAAAASIPDDKRAAG